MKGDGRVVLHATYGHYAGRYNEAQIGVNSNVGNPDETIGVYTGPAGQGRELRAGFQSGQLRDHVRQVSRPPTSSSSRGSRRR